MMGRAYASFPICFNIKNTRMWRGMREGVENCPTLEKMRKKKVFISLQDSPSPNDFGTPPLSL